MSKRWEEQLFDAIREGDERAFERLYDIYQQRVRLAVWRISHRPDWIDEIVNESWCRAFANRRQFDGTLSFLAWMSGIAKNVYREECRKSLRANAEQAARPDVVRSAEELSPDAIAEEVELLTGLQDCISRLTETDAELIRLRYLEGHTLRSMSKKLGIPESTLRDVRLPSAIELLRKCLELKGIKELRFSPAQGHHENQ